MVGLEIILKEEYFFLEKESTIHSVSRKQILQALLCRYPCIIYQKTITSICKIHYFFFLFPTHPNPQPCAFYKLVLIFWSTIH